MSWQVAILCGLALVVIGGLAWYERSRPPARLVALVAALAGLAVAARLVLAPIPNVVGTTDVALLTGYALGGPPGFAVGALAAPVSNIWLGQGPWTAWQMAGWGLVGIGGAWLAAVSGRRLGRWGLAIACGLAGLAYGALLDLSIMVTYGGEQSLDRFLALSARAIPFNLAHAAGNFAIALAAGPALVRMISRYRTRLEFSWRPATALPITLVALAIGATALVALGRAGGQTPANAWASAQRAEPEAPGDTRQRAAPTRARAWLVRSQNRDGGFGASRESPSSAAMTGWVMLGLEAAGRNPLDVRAGRRTPVTYLRAEVDRLRSPGDLERTILALAGAGLDPRRFAGADLVAELRERRRRDGSIRGQVNLSAFFVLALRAAGAERGDLARPVRWLRRAQNRDGGWGFRTGAPSDPDSSGAALQALAAAGSGGDASAGGARWLRRAQRQNGGYALATNGVVNAQSTAWAAQGLIASGEGAGAVNDALDHLDSLRAADGHYRYSPSSDQTPVWVTAQALLAVQRRALPLAAVARQPDPSSGDQTGVADPGDQTGVADPGSAIEPTPTPSPASGAPAPAIGAGNGAIPSGGGAAGDGVRRPPAGGPSARQTVDGPPAGTAQAPAPPPGAASLPAPEAEEPAPAAPHETVAAVEEEPVAPYVAGGLALLGLALIGGFFWYRRRLP